MSYSSLSDILEQLSEAELIRLTDDASTGAVDEQVVARAVTDADAEIEAYLGERYTLPFLPVPPLVRKLSVDIALYNLYSRRLAAPEPRERRYQEAKGLLREAARGLVKLGAEAPAETAAQDLPEATTSEAERTFTLGRGGNPGSLDDM
jgi:phage gp36-like protein